MIWTLAMSLAEIVGGARLARKSKLPCQTFIPIPPRLPIYKVWLARLGLGDLLCRPRDREKMSKGQEKPSQLAVSTADQKDSEKDDDSLDTPIGCLRCRKEACRQCCCKLNNYWKSVIWLSIITVYLFLGGAFFNLAERPAELERVAEVNAANASLQAARSELIATVANNSNLTEEQVVEILQNFTAASQRLNDAQEAIEVVQVWDFPSAVFFCVTVITTIGEK